MTHRIGYAVLLDDESHNYAREIELDLSLQFKTRAGLRQSPHITIKPPFFVEDIEPFVRYFDNLAKQLEPFEIELQGFDFFEPKVVFLNVVENPTLKKIHKDIVKDLQNDFEIEPNVQTEGDNVRFHSTVALSDLSEENFYKAKNYVSNKTPHFKFTASTLGMFYHLSPEEGWIIYRRAKIGS